MCYRVRVLAVVDSSTWISLARAGLLDLVGRLPVEPVILDVVFDEAVDRGLQSGRPDATAIAASLHGRPITPSPTGAASVDAAVLLAARAVGALVANDLALGRRARNLGVLWLRTADLVVLAVRTSAMAAGEGRDALSALEASGRLAADLADAYRDELR